MTKYESLKQEKMGLRKDVFQKKHPSTSHPSWLPDFFGGGFIVLMDVDGSRQEQIIAWTSSKGSWDQSVGSPGWSWWRSGWVKNGNCSGRPQCKTWQKQVSSGNKTLATLQDILVV